MEESRTNRVRSSAVAGPSAAARWHVSVALGALALSAGCFSGGTIGAADGSVSSQDGSQVDAADAGPADADPPDALPLMEGVVTLVGSSNSGDIDGERNVARFNNPVNVVRGPDGNLYVTDFYNGTVRQVTPSGTVTTVTRDPSFVRPFGIVFAPTGELYVQTDRNSQGAEGGALWRIDSFTGKPNLLLDDIGRPRGLAALADGRLVLSNYFTHVVSTWLPGQPSPTPLAGANDSAGYVDATGTAARFDQPMDVVVDGNGDLVVADLGNNVLRKVTLAGVVTTLAGNGDAATVDGPALEASFYSPKALAIDDQGRIFVTEADGHVIRMVADGQVTTVAGDGDPGFRDGDPATAEFFGVEGLDQEQGYLYIADGDGGEAGQPYHRIRRVSIPQ